ncbi:MAG TPA: hypothetical protein VK034_12570, partial [Enhygromyxa sp.]|nr:hypothetical protein [Enhygromyxa sp.]
MHTSRRLVALGSIFVLSLLPIAGDAEACGWDWETYHAEAKSLPCVHDALLGYWPKHTDEYHQARIEAADHALRWLPGWTEGLDAKGLSLLRLGRLDEAEAVMKRRHAIAPAAYPGHANLGTLYTFTGDFAGALEHIDAAMAIEPEAHFGREQYHRKLVEFLQRTAADPEIATRENFLGIELDDHQRTHGSRALYQSLGLDDDAFDALVSMITVYGADGLAEIYLTLGELLAARGHLRLAYTAYRRARELGHVRGDELRRWMNEIDAQLKGDRRKGMSPDRGGDRGGYRGIGERYKTTLRDGASFQKQWGEWEREQIARDLPVWTRAGLDVIYARMHEQRRRCDAPRIITDK